MNEIEYWQFEAEVENALRRCLVKNEILQRHAFPEDDIRRRRYRPDFYCPNGCEALKMKGAFIVEAKMSLKYDSVRTIEMLYGEFQLPLIIVVLDDKFKSYIGQAHLNFGITILSLSELKEIGNRTSKQQNEPINNIVKAEASIDDLRNAFYRGNVTLFLGAGVSASAKMPTWSMLIERFLKNLNVKVFGSDDYPALSASSGHSPIITARYITSLAEENGIDEVKQAASLRDALYEEGKVYTSKLLKSIAALCKKEVSGTRIVTSIITLNYDDLMEQHLKKARVDCTSLYESGIPERNQLPVIHVHGILHQDKQIVDFMPVLAEQKYHQLYMQSSNWSNVDILHAFQRTTCIFIGMSMLDPNLRRLLEFAHSQTDGSISHYAILPNKTLANYNWDSPTPTKYYSSDDAKESDFKNLQSKTLADLGVKILWYDDGDYDKVPEYINRIAKE